MGYKSPFASHYVPLRIKKRRFSIILSERHRYVGRPPPPQLRITTWKTCARGGAHAARLFAYRRIAKHVIHLRQVSSRRRGNPPRGEARSTGNHERAPAVMIYRVTLRCTRVCGGGTYAGVAVAIVPGRFVDRQTASGVISSKFGTLLHSLFFFFSHVAREKLAPGDNGGPDIILRIRP